MAVIVGSARLDERGKISGGKAGDQGKEVSTQNWYAHAKGWVVLRPRDTVKAEKIAQAMQAACDNPNIGYDQNQRDTLYAAVRGLGFDLSKVRVPVETDCSALVRVCCAFAGITLPNFTTGNQASVLMASGERDVVHGVTGWDNLWVDPTGTFFASTTNAYIYPLGYTNSAGTRMFFCTPRSSGKNLVVGTQGAGTCYIRILYTLSDEV